MNLQKHEREAVKALRDMGLEVEIGKQGRSSHRPFIITKDGVSAVLRIASSPSVGANIVVKNMQSDAKRAMRERGIDL